MLGNEAFKDPNCFGWDPWMFVMFSIEVEEENLKNPFDRPWGAAPTRVPQENLSVTFWRATQAKELEGNLHPPCSGAPRLSERLNTLRPLLCLCFRSSS